MSDDDRHPIELRAIQLSDGMKQFSAESQFADKLSNVLINEAYDSLQSRNSTKSSAKKGRRVRLAIDMDNNTGETPIQSAAITKITKSDSGYGSVRSRVEAAGASEGRANVAYVPGDDEEWREIQRVSNIALEARVSMATYIR